MTNGVILEKRKKGSKKPRVDDGMTPAHEASAAIVEEEMRRSDCDKRFISARDRRRLAREGNALVGADGHISYPIETAEDVQAAARLARTGHGDVEAARELIARRAKELGVPNPLDESSEKALANPVAHPHSRSGSYVTDRESAPLSEGRAANSPGNPRSNFDRASGAAEAWRMPEMRQSTTVLPWQTLRSVNGDNEFGDRDITRPPGTVSVQQLQVQHPEEFTSQPSGNASARRRDHPSRQSATPPNGSHIVSGNVQSTAVSCKSESPLEIMRKAVREQIHRG